MQRFKNKREFDANNIKKPVFKKLFYWIFKFKSKSPLHTHFHCPTQIDC